jgi:DNA polymerase IV
MDRQIAHMDMDTFFVSVERLRNSRLNGLPILIGGHSDRAVVASCSYEARQFGVHSAMPMRLARQLCPDAIIIRGDMDEYSRQSRIVTEIITEAAPIVEKTSIDEHYLDLSGMDKHFGTAKWMHELRLKVIKETGLPISFGLSVNKTVSKIATGQAKPNGEIRVLSGTEKPFLAPLSVRKIPMIGERTFSQLVQMGVKKIETIQQVPVDMMEHALGENGVSIWRKANAIDDSMVVPYSERKSISQEETFQQDTTDVHMLRKIIITMVDQLAFSLRKEKKLASLVTLKLRYSNFDTETKQARVPYTSIDSILSQKALELFEKLYSRRMLVRLIGVKLGGFVSGSYQIDLFSDTAKSINLCQAMDRIRLRFGDDALKRAISL